MDQFLNLTPKQALFCDEYFKDFNATKAALRAGYSAETALSGYLMTLPKIKCHLQQRGAEAAEKAQVTHAMLLAELKVVAFARMSHFFGSDGKPKAMQDVDEDTKAALLNYTVREDKQGATTIKIRMNNKLSALDKLAKHLKFYDAQYPAHSAMYWVISNPVLAEQDRFEDAVVENQESRIENQDGGGEEKQEARVKDQDREGQMTEVEADRIVAEAVAAVEERMRAEFAVKLKKAKKKAKKKLKNTEEYPRVGGEKQESRCKNQDEGGSQMLEGGGQVVGDNTNNGGGVGGYDVGENNGGDLKNTEEYRRVAGCNTVGVAQCAAPYP